MANEGIGLGNEGEVQYGTQTQTSVAGIRGCPACDGAGVLFDDDVLPGNVPPIDQALPDYDEVYYDAERDLRTGGHGEALDDARERLRLACRERQLLEAVTEVAALKGQVEGKQEKLCAEIDKNTELEMSAYGDEGLEEQVSALRSLLQVPADAYGWAVMVATDSFRTQHERAAATFIMSIIRVAPPKPATVAEADSAPEAGQ